MSFSWLPLIYREVAEQAGLDAALGLARARGGQRISVPKSPGIAQWLEEAMGLKGAAALCSLYGGEMIDLPTDPVGGQRARVRRIRQAIKRGASANEIAQNEKISRRQVFWHKERLRTKSVQTDLFDRPSDK